MMVLVFVGVDSCCYWCWVVIVLRLLLMMVFVFMWMVGVCWIIGSNVIVCMVMVWSWICRLVRFMM